MPQHDPSPAPLWEWAFLFSSKTLRPQANANTSWYTERIVRHQASAQSGELKADT